MPSESYDDILQKAQGLSVDKQQELIRELSQNVSREQKHDHGTLGQRMAAHGLLGVANGPADLSTNPDHMKGFGEDGDR